MNIREPLERIGKWREYQDAVNAQDWPVVKALLFRIGCTPGELKTILWSLHAPGTETEVETTSDKIIGRVGTILIAAVAMGTVFAWQASGLDSRAYRRNHPGRTAMTDYRPWKPVVGTAFAGGAVIGGLMGAAALRMSGKRKS